MYCIACNWLLEIALYDSVRVLVLLLTICEYIMLITIKHLNKIVIVHVTEADRVIKFL